jgi:hypothetical protein
MADGVGTHRRRPLQIASSSFSSDGRRAALAHLGRFGGALALLGVGIDHIDQYWADSYSAIPTIGTLFALNFVSATFVGLGLLAPVRRLTGRWADAALALLAVSGIGIATGSLAGLLISERSGLFGFMEQGYRSAIVVSIVLEVATVLLLGIFLAENGFGIRLRDGRIRPR